MAEILKFSMKHPTDKVNAAVRKHSREEAEQHKFIGGPKAKKKKSQSVKTYSAAQISENQDQF